jgi:hypothetical protein
LSVVTKVEAETRKVKKRVVLDTSRHRKKYAVKQTVHLDDLGGTAAMVERNNFSCIFDVENQFFHVQLDPKAKKYFRFALQITRGEKEYFCFNIMVYGFESSVAVVTRLIKLLQGLLHEAGISTLMTAKYWAALKMKPGRTWRSPPFQLAGWIIQWNVHLKSLAHRVASRLTMADMERALTAVENQNMCPLLRVSSWTRRSRWLVASLWTQSGGGQG